MPDLFFLIADIFFIIVAITFHEIAHASGAKGEFKGFKMGPFGEVQAQIFFNRLTIPETMSSLALGVITGFVIAGIPFFFYKSTFPLFVMLLGSLLDIFWMHFLCYAVIVEKYPLDTQIGKLSSGLRWFNVH